MDDMAGSNELFDIGRLRLTELGYQYVQAEHHVSGEHVIEIVRRIVHERAEKEIHRAEMIRRLTRSVKVSTGESEG